MGRADVTAVRFAVMLCIIVGFLPVMGIGCGVLVCLIIDDMRLARLLEDARQRRLGEQQRHCKDERF